MRIVDIRGESRQDGVAIATARVLPDGAAAPLDLWYRFEGVDGLLQGLGDAMAVGMLTPCMLEGEPLTVEESISGPLLDNMTQAQQVFASWYDYLTPVSIFARHVDRAAPPPPNGAGVACCFTAGVDSWYSLLKHEPTIRYLLLVRGFDIGLTNNTLWKETRARIARIAERLGKRLITCETNLRELADKQRAGWGRRFDGDFWGEALHGSALASVALLLQHKIAQLIIPATHTYRQVKPWGSSPMLDSLWSNHRLRIMHDGCEAGRVDKTRAIASCDLALETLRVCYYDLEHYNCGRCEKCLRTMMALRACGALDRATTFSAELSLREVHRMIVPAHVRHRYDELLAEARRVGDGELLKAIQIVMEHRFSARHSFARFRDSIRNTRFGHSIRPLIRRLHRTSGDAPTPTAELASRKPRPSKRRMVREDRPPLPAGVTTPEPMRPEVSEPTIAVAGPRDIPSDAGRRSYLRRAAAGIAWGVRHAVWRARKMEYACSLLEKELSSTVMVPWHAKLRLWRRGFLGESWTLYGLHNNNCQDYLSDHARFVRTRLINGRYGVLLDDKLVFGRFFSDFAHYLTPVFGTVANGTIRMTCDTGPGTDAEAWLLSLLHRHGAVVLKPVTGGGGRGFTLLRIDRDGLHLNGRRIDERHLREVIRTCDGYMICGYVSQHPALAGLYPRTTNTIRLVTMQDDACDAFVATAVLRIGSRRSEPADNWTRGGFSASIELANGRVGKAASYPAFRNRMEWHDTHPDSGAQIAGFEIPNWSLITNGVLEMCRAVPALHYVGWDIVVTEDSFRVIEGNNYTDVNLLQIHGPLLVDDRVAAFYRRHGVLRAA